MSGYKGCGWRHGELSLLYSTLAYILAGFSYSGGGWAPTAPWLGTRRRENSGLLLGHQCDVIFLPCLYSYAVCCECCKCMLLLVFLSLLLVSEMTASCLANDSVSLDVVILNMGSWDTCEPPQPQAHFPRQVFMTGVAVQQPMEDNGPVKDVSPRDWPESQESLACSKLGWRMSQPKESFTAPIALSFKQGWLELRTAI